MRVLRFVLIPLLTLPLLAVTGTPASAGICTLDADTSVYDPPPVDYPCPDGDDQPAPAPVWISTDSGPGFDGIVHAYRISRGARVFFANVNSVADENHGPERLWGSGFDSGVVPVGQYREVIGTATLPLGRYNIYSITGSLEAFLYVDPPLFEVGG